MSRFIKLPDSLRAWKINSVLSKTDIQESYKVCKRDYDGSICNGTLIHISAYNDRYNPEFIKFLEEEAKFLKTISNLSIHFIYQEIVIINNTAKNKADLYIITEDLPKLSALINSKNYSEAEIVGFGIQISNILDLLESKNIYHGNLTPENIYLSADGQYKIGGFSDFEGKIEDMTFIAPEIAKNGSADFTTDIYSLGLIMYCMANNNLVPFESNIIDRKSATEKRLDGMSVSAPENGSEKLKSVIIIACQLKNQNRWKNAGNIKNALLSIQSELPKEETATPTVALEEKTNFEENVFDEYEYDEFSVVEPVLQPVEINERTEEITFEEISVETESNENLSDDDNNEDIFIEEPAFEIADVSEIDKDDEQNFNNDISIDEKISVDGNIDLSETQEKAKTQLADENNSDEINEDIFDNYDVDGSTTLKTKSITKDYGDYFDDEVTPISVPEKSTNSENASTDNFTDDINEDKKPSKKKGNIILITVSILIILATIGFIAFCAVEGLKNKPETQPSTTEPSTIETTEATTEPTTEPTTVPKTEPTTTLPQTVEITSVVGYWHSYGGDLLKNAGFTVVENEFEYNSEYDYGYIYAQEPAGGTQAEKGSTVTLYISAGPEETTPPTEAPTQNTTKDEESSSSQNKDDKYIFANSDSSYLTLSNISSLDRTTLNLALNEIYARKGRIFQDSLLSEYFNAKSWYTPKYTSAEFSQKVTFNKYEQANLQLIIDEQIKKGYR